MIKSGSSMPYLPLFPLRLVAFPGESLNLHIFEPRYRQLIGECHSEGTTFGINVTLEGKLMPVGTEIELLEIVQKHPKGEMDVRCRGVRTYRLRSYDNQAPEKLYAGGSVSFVDTKATASSESALPVLERLRQLYQRLRVRKEIEETPENFSTYQYAHHIGLSLEQEYELLTIPSEEHRRAFMLRHIEQLLPQIEEQSDLQRRVSMNGHFKNALPPDLQ